MRQTLTILNFIVELIYMPAALLVASMRPHLFPALFLLVLPFVLNRLLRMWYRKTHADVPLVKTKLELYLDEHVAFFFPVFFGILIILGLLLRQ